MLAAGGLVAFPTETVYGLGADATNGEAVARLYEAKGRPSFNPLIAHVTDAAAARALARFDAAAERLAAAFWPGPLTLVLPRRPDCPVAELATAGSTPSPCACPTIRSRATSWPRSAGRWWRRRPTAPATSRRPPRSTCSPTCAGASSSSSTAGRRRWGSNRPSSPVSTRPCCCGRARCRARRSSAWSLSASRRPRRTPDDAPLAPGQLASHYAPRARLRLDAQNVQAGEALLAFGPALPAGAERAALVLNLSARGDLIEAAANLFSHLRALDAAGAATIAVMPVPHAGLGEAINDRLARAAAPRA